MGKCWSSFQSKSLLDSVEEARTPGIGNARLMGHAKIFEKYEYVLDDSMKVLSDKGEINNSQSQSPSQQVAPVGAKVLGTGACGPVYLVQSKLDPEMRFALKELAKSKVPFLANEIFMYLLIDHPNIAKIVEVYSGAPLTPGGKSSPAGRSSTIYLVTEACLGGELFSLLKKERRLNEIAVIHLTRQILKAVNYLHEIGLAHGDLKLENFVFDKPVHNGNIFSATLKLIDFGFANYVGNTVDAKKNSKNSKDSKNSESVVPSSNNDQVHKHMAREIKSAHDSFHLSPPKGGSLLYFAPEKRLNGPATFASDTWGVGIIVFMMLTGYAPFVGKSMVEVGQSIATVDVAEELSSFSNNLLSHEAIDFITRCLEKDRTKRITAREALRHAWLSGLVRKKSKVNFDDLRKVARLMIAFSKEKPLRRACLGLIGLHILHQRSPVTLEVFDLIDKQNDGFLLEPEIAWFLDLYAPPIGFESHSVFEAMDLTGDGRVNYSEFVAATEIFLDAKVLKTSVITTLFKQLDRDNTGSITKGDLKSIFGDRGYKGSRIDELIAEADYAKDGVISYQEFDIMSPLPTHCVMSGISAMMCQIMSAFSARNLGKQAFVNVIKAGTICRTIVWPCIPPLMLYQYIRQKDEDYFALELLRSRGEIKDAHAVYNPNLPGSIGHWKIQDDLELIRSAANEQK